LTIATIPARTASRSRSHASMTAVRFGSVRQLPLGIWSGTLVLPRPKSRSSWELRIPVFRCSWWTIRLPLGIAIWQSASSESGCGSATNCATALNWHPRRCRAARLAELFLQRVNKRMQCSRCKKEFTSLELRPPAGLLRLLALPIQFVLPVGREIHASYCRLCRRRMNATLFFVCFFLALCVWMYFFLPRAAPRGTPKTATNAAPKL
jgi:hypothetical protein